MGGATSVRDLFSTYQGQLDSELRRVLAAHNTYPLYQHLEYFMGFKDEALQDIEAVAGKRFRSSLTLFLGDAYGVVESALAPAVAIELFHNFTLIHDDIVDEDTLRRGRPTVWKQFGVDHAINDGDAQLLLAVEALVQAEALSDTQKVLVQTFLLQQFRQVIEGQFLDFELTKQTLSDPATSSHAYFAMIGRKTADLIAASTGVIGHLAECSEAEQAALFSFGYELGLAYQVCDDVVSIWGSEAQTGKRKAGDVYEQKKTLPILLLLEALSIEQREIVTTIYNPEHTVTESDVDTLLELLETHSIYETVQAELATRRTKIDTHLHLLSVDSEVKNHLQMAVQELLPDIKAVE